MRLVLIAILLFMTANPALAQGGFGGHGYGWATNRSGGGGGGLTSPVGISDGGTGQTSKAAAFNALSPLTTLGDLLYGGASGAGTRLAGNTSTTRKYLGQTGTGSASQAPTFTQPNFNELLGACDLLTQVTNALPVANGGTGLASYTAGDTLYASGSTTLSKLAKGTAGQLYQMNAGATAPVWNTMSGDATISNTGAVTIANNAVTNAKAAQMAAHTYKGNNTGSTANAADITSTQLTADLNLFTTSLQGLTPASGGGTTNFLRADGSWAAPAGGGGGSVIPSTNDFRLTLTSATPVTTNNVTAATTLYLTPFQGNHISTYDASTWTDHTSAEISVAVPASLHRIYDVFAFYTGGALTLTTTAWDSGGQVTGTVTGATAANPCVITATNTLSNGDLVFIDGIVGSLGTDAAKGINGKCAVVASASGSGFTLQGMDTSGLTYTSGGTFYKVPTARTTAITRQDGVYCQSGALDHRYLGTICTVASGQTEDSASRRLLYNYGSNISRPLYAMDTTAGWSYAGSGATRAQNANTTAGVGRCEAIVGLAPAPVRVQNDCYIFSAGGLNNAVGVGVDSATTFVSNSSWNEPGTSAGACTFNYTGNLGAGYHFLQRLELAQGTATFGGTNAAYSNAGLTGEIFQ